MHSCLYRGTVQHHRFAPVEHRFNYPISLVYLDLSELLEVNERFFSSSRWGAFTFRRDRHFGPDQEPLDVSIRTLLRQRTGMTHAGPIRLLTMLDNFGYYFSPLNLFYCWNDYGSLEAVVAEVNNIPWREQHLYVLASNNEADSGRFEHSKEFHVSPFMQMGLRYRWNVPRPCEQLHVGIQAIEGEKRLFSAGMQLERQRLTRPALRRLLWQFPWMTGQIVAAIYYQAFLLWWKQCPIFTHPRVSARSHPRPQGLLPTQPPAPPHRSVPRS